jgi:exonuclease III
MYWPMKRDVPSPSEVTQPDLEAAQWADQHWLEEGSDATITSPASQEQQYPQQPRPPGSQRCQPQEEENENEELYNPAKKPIHIATLNVRGINEATKRQTLEKWADDERIMILAVQETKINANSTETRSPYTWYFSSGVSPENRDIVEQKRAKGQKPSVEEWRRAAEHHGVGIMVHQKIKKAILEIHPISARLMHVVVDGKPKIHILSCYAPQAARPILEKEAFYDSLDQVMERIPRHDMVITMGDFNARILERLAGEDSAVGKFYFRTPGITTEQMAPELWENRELMIQFALKHQMIIKNTQYQKDDKHLVTYRAPGVEGWDPIVTGQHDQVDYIMIGKKWANSIQDTATTPEAGIYSDHVPIMATIKVKYAMPKRRKKG